MTAVEKKGFWRRQVVVVAMAADKASSAALLVALSRARWGDPSQPGPGQSARGRLSPTASWSFFGSFSVRGGSEQSRVQRRPLGWHRLEVQSVLSGRMAVLVFVSDASNWQPGLLGGPSHDRSRCPWVVPSDPTRPPNALVKTCFPCFRFQSAAAAAAMSPFCQPHVPAWALLQTQNWPLRLQARQTRPRTPPSTILRQARES